MKALSIHQPFASLIAQGFKTIETRRRRCKYRGDLLIVSTLTEVPWASPPGWRELATPLPFGQALAVVRLADCRRMDPGDADAAWCEYLPVLWSWCLEDLRPVKPFAVRGWPGFFNVADELIEYISGVQENGQMARQGL